VELKPGYKLTEVGVIPDEWEVTSFGKLLAFTNGVNAGKTAYGKGVRFINVLEPITYSHIYGPEIPGRVEIPASIASAYLVRQGDVVFNRTSETDTELGLAAAYLGVEHVVFGGFVIRGRPIDDTLDPTFSGYALRGPMIRSQIIPMGQGAIRANIGQQNLRQVLVAVPPKSEQRAIAEALSDVDALLGGLDHLIAKKRDLKQAAMQQLLTRQTRLPGFHGEWEVKRLGESAEIVMGQSPSSSNYNSKGDGLPLIQGNADIANRRTIRRIFTTQVTKRGQAGDILMSVRAPVGEVSRATFDVCLGRGVCAIRFPNDFLYHCLIFLESNWAKHSKGSTFDSVNSADVSAVEISLPSDFTEQTAIAAVLSDMDTELSALEARRDKTRALKQAMMQELLTGRTRLVSTGGADA
jgi:type I restriction enzyme S subunit